tara:strand:+ start:77 stop:301 length:225 start_codon:yes stop_codon:yes gene_type:complete
MLACKKKIFNKFFIFSFVFLVFSFCCNAGSIVTSDSKGEKYLKKSCQETEHVQTQQRKIIHSLKNIERNLKERN